MPCVAGSNGARFWKRAPKSFASFGMRASPAAPVGSSRSMRSRKRRGAARPPPPSPVGEQAQVTIVRTAQAEEDLIDIWCYIASDNPRAAHRLLVDLHTA